MSSESSNSAPTPSLTLPDQPDLRHLRDQARDIHREGLSPNRSGAQFILAQRYGFASWPKLKAFVDALSLSGELKSAIDTGEYARVKEMMTRHPDLHRAPMGYNRNGPLTWVAECRVPRVAPSPLRLELAEWMIENGSNVHQGGEGPLMRAALDDDRIAMMQLLVGHGADVNALWNGHYPIIFAPCETLASGALRWLLDHGADPYLHQERFGSPIAMVLGTYSRNAGGKHACLEVFDASGFTLPNTPCMALARGRMDLLEQIIAEDPAVLNRRFPYSAIYPPEIGMKEGEGLTSTPLDGTTLLHQAIEFEDTESARWLLDHGADANAGADINSYGYGGQTPLFHAVISMGRSAAERAELLMKHGADPGRRATFRKQLIGMDDPEKDKMFEFNNVTPVEYAAQYQEQAWVNTAALAVIARHQSDAN